MKNNNEMKNNNKMKNYNEMKIMKIKHKSKHEYQN
jgi:hypothetical protein